MRKRGVLRTSLHALFCLFLCLLFISGSAAGAGKVHRGTLTDASGTGSEVTGHWRKYKSGRVRFIDEESGQYLKGWLQLEKYTYYLGEKGFRVTGLKQIGDQHYCFNDQGRIQTGLMSAGGLLYFYDPEAGGARLREASREVDGVEYYFGADGAAVRNQFLPSGAFADEKAHPIRKSTIRQFLETAMQPVGACMYVWGGGWNDDDSGSGVDAVTMGVSPTWKAFFEKQNSSYSVSDTRFQRRNGLDCSGFVGWALYNSFNEESGHGGYVMLAQNMARSYADWGWGSYTPAGTVRTFSPGDIMSTSAGHVYIVLGSCGDGSVVLVHASPKGVMISGTPARNGNTKSEANDLATSAMKKNFPAWYAKFPDSSRPGSYLTSYSCMHWTVSGEKCVMEDPEGFQKMSAEEVLKRLFP